MVQEKEIKLDKVYESKRVDSQLNIGYDKNSKKRPSWIRVKLDKKVIFIKILFKEEAFWYRRYFEDYFFPLEATSEDHKNYYNEIAKNYESYVPQNKIMINILLDFFKELKIKKDSKILDLGAGTGLVTEGIVKEGYNNIVLADISEEELKIAKDKELLKNSKYQTIDLTKDEILGKFDIIYETMSLDYFKGEKMQVILEKIKNALNTNGKFIVIDRHIYPEFNNYFKEIKSGKTELGTPEGKFDYYYYIGEK
ncbi:MAG TPA: methyltransferase domain-containing protein [Candidatus Pacearchaeota archaeon]|nr:methyltransferase domain-containing protein [Candidatus Pacearchaeota archaeon]HQF83014.1 methyltransferase domain-containing protein [Candidatus Pacearchaeota archaeon]HQI57991.1 methyltransferase domain-containing protein [Candidatus Pacearchaeota archaeon]HQJ57904.1 methyltransferase domain-containing protein [Candidatus Pacearchaeota archaeon]